MISLSIIVTVYNAQEFLPECVDTLLKQNNIDYEIILVNDGSTDSSGEICEKYLLYNNVKVLHHKSNLGLIECRNTGIKASSGKYISFVDADDWVDDNLYHYYVNKMEENDEISISIVGTVKECITGECNYFYSPCDDMLLEANAALEEMFKRKIFGWELWGKIYRRSIMEHVSVDATFCIGEDLERNIQLWDRVKYVWISCKKSYHYRLHPKSMTQQISILDRNLWQLFEKIYKKDTITEAVRASAKEYLVKEYIKRILAMFIIDEKLFFQDIKFLYYRITTLIESSNVYQKNHGIAKNILHNNFLVWYNSCSTDVNQIKNDIINVAAHCDQIYIYLIDNDAKYLSLVLETVCDKYRGFVIKREQDILAVNDKIFINVDVYKNDVLILVPITSKNLKQAEFIMRKLNECHVMKVFLCDII